MERGIKTTQELTQLVQNYQAGNTQQPTEPITVAEQPEQNNYYKTARRDVSGGVVNTYTQEALSQGYGTKRYDKEYTPGEDIESRRAVEQSNFSKLTNYVGKGAVTAATTFANGTAGLVFGMLYGAADAAFDINDDGRHPLRSFVNNPFSESMEKLNDWSNRVMPTYLTAEQRSEEYQKEWYKHMFTTDFAGEFIQNFGFTVGAMFSGAAWSKALTALRGKSLADNVLKGAIVASEGDAEASAELRQAYSALQSGNLTRIDATKLTQNIQNVAKKINRLNTDVQLFGATMGALAEGDMEGIMARKEMMEDFNRKLSEEHDEKYAKAEEDVLNSRNGAWVTDSSVYDSESGTFLPMLTPEGEAEVLKRKREITQHEQQQIALADREGDRIATITFALNIPVLTASNAFQFGRMLSGGWKTTRKLYSLQGGIKTGANTIEAAYRPKGSIAGKSILKSLGNVLSESSEEMLQGFFSSGNKKYAMESLASFNNGAYDEDTIDSVRYWLENFGAGGMEYLRDPKNWKEGAMGGLTGLLGIPGKKWNGGVIGEISNAREEVNASRKAAEELNSLVNSDAFRSRWNGYIRHMKYDNDMKVASENNDEYAWHTADDAQIISDVVSFADADKLDDLVEIAESFKSVTSETINDIKQNLDWAKGLSNETIIQKIYDQADRMVNTINEYRDMYEALSSRAPIGASKEFIQEMVVTAQHIKAYERRFQEMLNDVIKTADPLLVKYGKESTPGNGDAISEINERSKIEELRTYFDSVVNATPVKFIPDNIEKSIDEELASFMTEANFDTETKQKVSDMRRLIQDRKAFYNKLQFMRGEAKGANGKTISAETAQEAFDKAAMTPEKVDDASAKAYAKEQTENLNTLDDVRAAYNEKQGRDRDEFFATLKKASGNNPAIKSFVDMKDFMDEFDAFVSRTIDTGDESLNVRIHNAISQILDNASSVGEIKNLQDNLFDFKSTVEDKAAQAFASAFGMKNVGGNNRAEEIKSILRNAMRDFLRLKSDTQADVKQKPVVAEGGTATGGTGYDAPAPASTTGTPKASEQTENREAPNPTEPVAEYPTEAEEQAIDLESQNDKYYDFQEGVESKSVTDEDGKKKHPYYRSSVPEIDSFQAADAREAIKNNNPVKYREADLSDFVEKHSEYSEVWNALKDRGAFDYVSTELKEDDEIEFIIDPTFPKYNGQTQILVAKNVDGKHQVLSVFTYKNDDYIGVNDLRKKILDEYDKFVKTNPNDIYVFGEKSKVFAIRPGLIEYKYDKDSEKSIHDVPSYSESAPIVAILRNRETGSFETTVIRGDVSVKADADKVIAPSAKNKYGMYYLVKSNAGALKYVPVRLNVARFNSETAGLDQNKTISDIGNALHRIASIVVDADKDNYKDKLVEMRKAVGSLGKLIDIHNDYFDLKYSDDRGAYLFLAQDAFKESLSKEDRKKPKSLDLKYEDETKISMWLFRQVQKMNRHIQIDDSTTPDKLQSLIDDNLVTTNAQRLRMKGVDFWFDSWDASEGKFLNPKDPWEREDTSDTTEKPAGNANDNLDGAVTPDDPITEEDLESALADANKFDEPIYQPVEHNDTAVVDVADIYNRREETKDADKGKPGRAEVIAALYNANPNLVQFKNEQDRLNAITDVIEAARKYPNLAISQEILSSVQKKLGISKDTPLNVYDQDDVNSVLNGGGTFVMQKLVNGTFDELPEDIRKDLLDNDYDDETWAGLSNKMKERLLACRNV